MFLGNTVFVRFQLTVFENKCTFMKKAALHTTMHWCTATLDKFYAIYLVLTKKMAQISSII